MRLLPVTCLVAVAGAHRAAAPPSRARAPAASTDPCRDSDLDLDRAAPRCTVHEPPLPPPAESALRVQIVPSDIAVYAGNETPLLVQMINATAKPMTLDLTFGCDPLEIWVYAEAGETRVDLEEEADCQTAGVVCNRGSGAVWGRSCGADRLTEENIIGLPC